VRWFTDFSGRDSYPFIVIFPRDEEMTLITNSGAPPEWAVRGVKNRFASLYFVSVHYTSAYEAELAVKILKKRKGARIGLVGKSSIPLPFYEHVRKHLPGCTFLDTTDLIDQIKVIKSSEEQDFIRQTAELQDRAIEHLKKVIKPGRRDFEIFAEAQYSVVTQGSERQLILVGSGPPGNAPMWQPRRFQNRVIRDGDQISILIEANGPGGFYTEIARIFSIGKPSQELQDAFGVALEAQKITLNLLKPGAQPRDIWDVNNKFLEGEGYLAEKRLYAHGQGYDLVERPLIRFDEPMDVKVGMNIAVHPTVTNEKAWAVVCDNYLILENRVTHCLHKTPKEIIVI